jgi:hypothetical protein
MEHSTWNVWFSIGCFICKWVRIASYVPTTGSLTGYNASNQLYAGASYGSDTGFYTGSIANISVNNADLDGLTVNKNYNAFASRFGLPVRRPLVTDADAFAFVEVAGYTMKHS